MTDKANDPQLGDVLRQLCAREPIFHRREYGTSRADLERMTDEAFWEIGASGNTYQRSYVIDKLLECYAQGPEPHDWPCRDFAISSLETGLFLLSNVLEEPERVTRRSTIWRRTGDGRRIVFHHGIIVR